MMNYAMHTIAGSPPTLGQQALERFIFGRIDQTELVRPIDNTFMLIFWISVFSFVLLMGLMMYFVVRYKRRPGVPVQRSASHNTVLEIAWTVLPTIALVIMFFQGFWVYMEQAIAPGNALQMQLSAKKWAWSITYPNGAFSSEVSTSRLMEPTGRFVQDSPNRAPFEIPIFYMPANTPVKLRMNSQDVTHAFWIPDFRIKFDVYPNRYTSLWFEPSAPEGGHTLPADHPTLPGAAYEDHWVFCAEYCGEQHSEMAAIIRVVSYSDYQKWADANAIPAGLTPAELGARLYIAKGCNACHSLDGAKNIGPTWKGAEGSQYGFGATVPLADGTTVVNDENYLRESILVPAAKIHAGYPNQMPSYQGQLSDKELEALIEFIKTLGAQPAGGTPAAAPASEPAPAPEPKPAS